MSSLASLSPVVFASHIKQCLFTTPMTPRELRDNEEAMAYADLFLARMFEQALPATGQDLTASSPASGTNFLMAFIVSMNPTIVSPDPSNPDQTGMLVTSQNLVETTKDVIEYILERELSSFAELSASVSEEFLRNHDTFKNVLEIWKRNEVERGMVMLLAASRTATDRFRQYMAEVGQLCVKLRLPGF